MDAHSLERLDFYRIRELLADCAQSGLGRSLACNIQPVTRLGLVQRWLAQVIEMQRLSEERGLPPFGGIADVREVLPRCAPPLRVTVEEVAQIGATLAGTHAIVLYLKDLPEDFPELRHLAERVGDFRNIADRISEVIDDRARVRDDASPKLQRIRLAIDQASRQIHETVAHLLHEPSVRRFLQYPNHTFHGDRLVLPLRTEYRGRLPGIVHRTSDSGATLYVEPAAVVELNNRISNLRSEEQEEIGRLLWALAHEIHLNRREIHKTLETLAVIDLIVAKVRLAREFDLRCPQINDEGTLSVRAARHPLLLDLARRKRAAGMTPNEVVPIDYRLGLDFNLLIITGPNTGGKTVTLKTVGLLSLMVQAGLPVPVAPGSEMGVFSNVLIDVGDEQSMQQSLSTFSAHLTRLLEMLRHAGPRALVLIDELGAGTDPDEGAAIGRAILDELLRLQCRCIATTHLGALKGFALTRPRAENACVEFDSQTLKPTYHLALGEPGSSNAIEIAGRLGMSRRLVNEAHRNISRRARALHAAIESSRAIKRQAEMARREAETAKLEADRAHGEADATRVRLERQQADFQQWVQRVVHLGPGDAVRVRDFDRDGRVVRLRLDQQRAEVDVGTFSVEVPLGDVLPPQTPPPPPRPEPRPRVAVMHSTTRPTRAPQGGARQSGRGSGPHVVAPPGRPARGQQAAQTPDGRDTKPPPTLPSLTDEQVAALQPLDPVYVKRFHREGRVARVNPAKKLVIVTVGLLEVEVPFDGLALPPKREPVRAQPAKAKPKDASRKGETPTAAAVKGEEPKAADKPGPAPPAPQPAQMTDAAKPEPAPDMPESNESPADADADPR